MELTKWLRLAMLPGPTRSVRGRLRHIGAGVLGLGVVTIYLHLAPGFGSPTWWLLLLSLAVAALIPFLDWVRRSDSIAMPLVLACDLLVTGILMLNPDHAEVSTLYIITTAFAAGLFDGKVVLLHVGVVLTALLTYVAKGGPGSEISFTLLAVGATVAFLRGMNAALFSQVRRAEALQWQLELLPVLKAHGVEEVVRAAIRQLVKVTQSDAGIVAVLDEERNTLRSRYLQFEKPIPADEEEAWRQVEIPVGRGLAGWVGQHKKALITGDAERDPRAFHVPGTPYVDESLIVVPLLAHGKLYGVLRLNRDGLNKYTEDDLALVELMAAHVSDALSRAALEERLSRTDALTGAYNRHYLNEWTQLLEPTEREMSLLMCDCRKFKQINDLYGHLAGDRILQEAARLIRESVRSVDLVVRYGGDEFLVVLRGTSAEDAALIARRLSDRVDAWNATQPTDSPRLLLDIGVDTAPEAEWQMLMERADARMYASKRAS